MLTKAMFTCSARSPRSAKARRVSARVVGQMSGHEVNPKLTSSSSPAGAWNAKLIGVAVGRWQGDGTNGGLGVALVAGEYGFAAAPTACGQDEQRGRDQRRGPRCARCEEGSHSH